MATHPGPHQQIAPESPRDQFTCRLFDTLWHDYKQRVSYVRTYEKVVEEAGATFVNDHIAFRTFAWQQPFGGISVLSRIFEALGYQAAGCYYFPDKFLNALHFQHPHPEFPKLFISELQMWKLSAGARKILQKVLPSHRELLPLDSLAALGDIEDLSDPQQENLLQQVVKEFEELPWILPNKPEVIELEKESQYAAWVLVHGYRVNHFTSLINSHGVDSLNDIEKTIAALKNAGVPMKSEIEGARGSKLRQTATAAVVTPVQVLDQGETTEMDWTYAYFELAERGSVTDPESGKDVRFEGFLGPQATQLFEMTRRGK